VAADMDLALLYKLIFDLEGEVFKKGMARLIKTGFKFKGFAQKGKASYYTRRKEDQIVDFARMRCEEILRRIRAFGISSQGVQGRIGKEDYRLFAAEKITNPHLLARFSTQRQVGAMLASYAEKFLVKAKDGIIKINAYQKMQKKSGPMELREISRADVPVINQWRNDKKLVDLLGSPFRFINIETDEAWFEDYLKNRMTQVRCGMYTADKNKLVGVVYLTHIDHINRNAELSIMIGPSEARHKGLGALAVKEMLSHAFNDLALNKVYLNVVEDNKRAVEFYRRMGFVKEGELRKASYKNGQYKDVLVMGILKSEFLSLKNK
jgi:RimJ/RimL family protein N-acetyltransferase